MAETKTDSFMPLNAETNQPCKVGMQELWVRGTLTLVGAKLVVRHSFQSEEDSPVELVYAFGLPRDAALRQFRVEGEEFTVRSELKKTEEAERLYEEGIDQGSLSVLTRQYGDGMVNLNVGNLRPQEQVQIYLEVVAGVEQRDDGFRFRFPFTLAPTYHSRARAVERTPGEGEMELPQDKFGDVLLPRWMKNPEGLHTVGFGLDIPSAYPLSQISSPSHPVQVERKGRTGTRVSLATEGDVPDRDLVIDVKYSDDASPRVISGLDNEGKGRFAVSVPSRCFGEPGQDPRDVVFVLDTSGSMDGRPISQAVKAVKACLGALGKTDRFGMVIFDNTTDCFRPELVPAESEPRQQALRYLDNVAAGGGTELLSGLAAGAQMMGQDGGDLLLVTDGQVSGTERVINAAKRRGVRVHCLGIGSSSQDRFLALLARKSGGHSRFLTPRERVDMAAVELFASAGRPVATEVTVSPQGLSGSHVSPRPERNVWNGDPLIVRGETDGLADGRLEITGKTAQGEENLTVPIRVTDDGLGETLRLLQGVRLIADLEAELGERISGTFSLPLPFFLPDSLREQPAKNPRRKGEGKREQNRRERRIVRKLEKLSAQYGLSSRLMSLVAVIERKRDKEDEIPRTQVVPVGMPRDTDFGSYFGPSQNISPSGLPFKAHRDIFRSRSTLMQTFSTRSVADKEHAEAEQMGTRTREDVLLELSGMLQADGGLPGDESRDRIIASVVALEFYLTEGHTLHGGAFSQHVSRLIDFLDSVDISFLGDRRERSIRELMDIAKEGRAAQGNWLTLASTYVTTGTVPPEDFWKEVDQNL